MIEKHPGRRRTPDEDGTVLSASANTQSIGAPAARLCAEAGAECGIRRRAVLLAVALTVLLCFVSIYGNIAQQTVLSGEYCLPGPILFTFAMTCGVNPLLALWDRSSRRRSRLAFSPRELAMMFLAMAAGSGLVCWILGSGLH